VELLVGGGENFALVDEVHPQSFEDAGLHEVADPALGHHRDADRVLDRADHLRVARPRHPALLADLRRDPLEGHHRRRPRLLGDPRLLGGDHIHDHPSAQHLRETSLRRRRRLLHRYLLFKPLPVWPRPSPPWPAAIGAPPPPMLAPSAALLRRDGRPARRRTATAPRAAASGSPRSRCPGKSAPPVAGPRGKALRDRPRAASAARRRARFADETNALLWAGAWTDRAPARRGACGTRRAPSQGARASSRALKTRRARAARARRCQGPARV